MSELDNCIFRAYALREIFVIRKVSHDACVHIVRLLFKKHVCITFAFFLLILSLSLVSMQVQILTEAWEYTSADQFLHCLPLHHIL